METTFTHTQPIAVQCRSIDFGYSAKKPVLQNLFMSVPQSSIYSLLGASSSGKTTLIKIITGTLRPNGGDVTIFGQPLGSIQCTVPGTGIGYMPQDLAIYPLFSVESTLRYFGRINRMNQSKIDERIRFLKKYLELPDEERRITQLSGGQQRRVSLAVALLHSPPLLILDEPTVGIDPLLRNKIWNFLQKLKQSGHTIIVSTHYIEETTNCDNVSYIRNGQLLCEQNPQQLILSSASSNLEEAFYKLCKHQDAMMERDNSIQNVPDREMQVNKEVIKCEIKQNTFTFNSFVAVNRRTWKLLVTDRLNLFLMLIYPSVVMYMISLAFYKLPAVDVAVLNRESSFQSNLSFANQLVDLLSQRVHVDHVNSSHQISSLIMTGKSMAGLTFSDNFTECFEQRIREGMFASDEVLECAQIRLHMDNTHFVRFWMFVFSLADSFKQAIFQNLPQMNENPRTLLPAIDFLNVNTGKELKMKFAMESYFVSGQITGLNFMLTFLMSGLLWLKDRENGIFERSQVHGVSQRQFFLSHLLVQAVIMAVSNVLLMLVAVWLFGLQLDGTALIAYLLLYLQTVSTILLGQLLAISTNCHSSYLTILAMLVFPCFFVSGSLWPLEGIKSPSIQAISSLLPLTRPTSAMRALISRHLPFTSPQVFAGFMSLLTYVALSFIACQVRL